MSRKQFSTNGVLLGIKQLNLDLHFLKTENCLSFKSDFDRPWSSKCLPIAVFLSLQRSFQSLADIEDCLLTKQVAGRFKGTGRVA